jgi:hypothetical protein
MFRRFRKPVTHAAALWILVGMAAGSLVATMAYMALLTGIREGAVQVFPPKTGTVPQEQLPSLFGTVLSVEADGLTVDSKQPYRRIAVDESTQITTVGGAASALAEIRPGAIVTATGKDAGGDTLLAVALVVLEHGAGESAPRAWIDVWKEKPALLGWSQVEGDEVVAVRELDFGGFGPDAQPPAASFVILAPSGAISERIEIDAEGLRRRKPLNAFMKPEDAEAELMRRGFVETTPMMTVSADGGFTTRTGRTIALEAPDLAAKRGFVLIDGAKRHEIVRLKDMPFAAGLAPTERLGAFYWLSPDGRYLLLVASYAYAGAGNPSIHLVDLAKLGIE